MYGILDSAGAEVMRVEYDTISFPESEKANAVIVELEGKYGIYSYDGEEILPTEYESIICNGRYSERYLVQKDGTQSITDLDGRIVKRLSGMYDKLTGDCFLTMCRRGAESLFEEVYNLNEEPMLLDGDIRSTSGLAFEIKDAKNLIGIYFQGSDELRGDGDTNSTIELMDENWNKVASYDFPYDDSYEYEYIYHLPQ
mgnify:FL=1